MSSFTEVTSGVPQGSVLGPLLFIILINDHPEGLNSTIRLFADDVIIYRSIATIENCAELQEDVTEYVKRLAFIGLKVNSKKSVVITVGKTKAKRTYLNIKYKER